MSIRIVVCIDVEADTPEEAYAEVHRSMRFLCQENPALDWESTDEWYDDSGERVSEEDISVARMATFARGEKESRS